MLKINGRLFLAMIYVIVTGINVGGRAVSKRKAEMKKTVINAVKNH